MTSPHGSCHVSQRQEAHLHILGHLSREEQGSHAALRDFLEDAIAVMPLDARPACLR